jgi:hypothetical protein
MLCKHPKWCEKAVRILVRVGTMAAEKIGKPERYAEYNNA